MNIGLDKVRAGDLARITHRTKDAIRNDIARNVVPWDDDTFEKGQQRRFDAGHVLALTISEILTQQGLSAARAGDSVKICYAQIVSFLENNEMGKDVSRINMMVCNLSEYSVAHGFVWTPQTEIGEAEVLSDIFKNQIKKFGKPTTSQDRLPKAFRMQAAGAVSAATINLLAAFQIAQKRAKAEGFVLKGKNIVRLSRGLNADGKPSNSSAPDKDRFDD